MIYNIIAKYCFPLFVRLPGKVFCLKVSTSCLFILLILLPSLVEAQSPSPPGIFRLGWGQRGFPLLIHKKKRLEVFRQLPPEVERVLPSLPPQNVKPDINESRESALQNTEPTFVMGAVQGDFADISQSYLKFIKPHEVQAEQAFEFNCIRDQKLPVESGATFYVYYYDPYLLIVGNGSRICEIDMFYGVRPVDFLPPVPPEYEWWIQINEYNSFRKGWIRFEDELFERNFNPRYLVNFDNRRGLVADFETLFLYSREGSSAYYGIYKVAGEYDKFDEVYKKTCIFFLKAEPAAEFPNEFNFTALDINPETVAQLKTTVGRLKFNWRGETPTAVLQTEADFDACTRERSTSREPLYFYERMKNFPVGIGLIIKRDRYLRPEKLKILPSENLLENFQSLESLRSDRFWNDPFRPAKEKFEELILNKWEPIIIHEIDGDWAEISVRRMKSRGWVLLDDLIYINQFQDFPEFEEFEQYLDDLDRSPL